MGQGAFARRGRSGEQEIQATEGVFAIKSASDLVSGHLSRVGWELGQKAVMLLRSGFDYEDKSARPVLIISVARVHRVE